MNRPQRIHELLAAGLATLRVLKRDPEIYRRLDRLAAHVLGETAVLVLGEEAGAQAGVIESLDGDAFLRGEGGGDAGGLVDPCRGAAVKAHFPTPFVSSEVETR